MEDMTLEELRTQLRAKRDKYAWLEQQRQRYLNQLRDHRETINAVESVVKEFHEGTVSVVCFSNAHHAENQVRLIERAMSLVMELIRRLTRRIIAMQNEQ